MSKGFGGIIGYKYKRAPIVVKLGQQYQVGDIFCGTVHLLITITKLRSDATGPSCHSTFQYVCIHVCIYVCMYVSMYMYVDISQQFVCERTTVCIRGPVHVKYK